MNEYILNIASEKYHNLIKDSNGDVSVFSSLKDEYNALRCGVALRDISSNVLLKLFGNNVLTFLDRLTTNKIDDISTNSNSIALFTNGYGKIIERANLLNMDNMVMISGCADSSKKIAKWISKYVSLEDIIYEDVTEKYFQLEIIGPQKEAFMSLICDDCFAKITDNNIVHVTINNYNFFVTRVKDFGIDKYFIFGNNEFLQPIAEYLFEKEKLFDLKLVGNAAYNIYRVEQGFPKAPNELNDFRNPIELGLSNEINFDKMNYIGHEVFMTENIEDVFSEKLVSFTIEDGFESNGKLDLINSKSLQIGEVSSLVKSKLLNKYLALAFVNKKVLDSGDEFFAFNGKNKFKLNPIELPLRK